MSCAELIADIIGAAFVLGIVLFLAAYVREAERARAQIEFHRNRIEPKDMGD